MLELGTTIGDYRLEERIGRGGMGMVFRATQLSLGRPVALKVIAPELAEEAEFRARFKREARLAARVDHPNVVPVHQADEQDGHLYIAMRYVPGTDARALLRRRGRLPPEHAVRIVQQIAAALDAAHGHGLVHRDVKPANVLLGGDEGREHVYLTDFGLTKQAASGVGMTPTGKFVGTLDYLAPEQARGDEVDGRADVYSLGCVLYELLTGSVPFKRDSDPAKLYAHMSEPPPRPSAVLPNATSDLDAVIARAMAKDPAARYAAAGDLAAAARGAIGATSAAAPATVLARQGAAEPPVPTGEEATRVQPPASTRGRWRTLVALGVAGAAVAAVAVVLASRPDAAPPAATVTAPDDGTRLTLLSPREIAAAASSTLAPQPPNTYVAANTIDGDPETAWGEGRPGPGTGATITWTFRRPVDVRRIGVVNGYAKGAQFAKNLRIRSAAVTTANGRVTAGLGDTADPQPLGLRAGQTDFVRLRIRSVYGDLALEDCLLSEIEFFVAGR